MMKVLVAVATHELQHVGAIRSAYLIRREPQDELIDQYMYRGDVAREGFVDRFLNDRWYGPDDAMLMLDGDQRHPESLLENLRAHDLDMVCAHCYRRSLNPVQSMCYMIGDGNWPYKPYLHPPREGVHEIAMTGFGCVLVKKKVFQAVKDILPEGANPVAIGPLPDEVGHYDNVSGDFRFFYLARKCGFKLWLDADVESEHCVTLWLGHEMADRLAGYRKEGNGLDAAARKYYRGDGVE